MSDGNKETSGATDQKHRWMLPVWAKTCIIAALAFTLAAAAAIVWVKVIQPKLNQPKTEVKYALVRADHSWKATKPSEKMRQFNINPTQYVMQGGGDDSQCFTFTGQGASPKHTVKVLAAFGDAKSRNLLLQQQPNLRMGMKSGRIKTQFCLVQTDNEFSVLATEALAESDYNDPSKTWDLLYDLMMTDSSGLDTTEQRAQTISGIVMKSGAAKVQGKPEITPDSITKGTFYQWAWIMGESQRADYYPAVFIDGSPVNGSMSIYNPDEMWRKIRSFPRG